MRAPAIGDVIAQKYRVESVVGQGGMGVVLSALHLKLGQSVAIKVLTLEGLAPERRHEAQARFLREAQAAAGLSSDHVVRVFDVGTLDNGVPFIVMELLSGDDLSAVLASEGPLPIERAVDYVAQACDAISEAHGRRIAHRDLKPANLFLARKKDGRTTVKVLDFGISKTLVGGEDPLEGNLTATRAVMGSPYYMSPEQVRDGRNVDLRTDVWSLGMILYELLLGEPAFDAETFPGICAAIVADPPPPIRMARADVPVELEGVILRCLEKDPAQRFQSVEELLLALAPFRPEMRSSVLHVSGARSGQFATSSNATRARDGEAARASSPLPEPAAARSSAPALRWGLLLIVLAAVGGLAYVLSLAPRAATPAAAKPAVAARRVAAAAPAPAAPSPQRSLPPTAEAVPAAAAPQAPSAPAAAPTAPASAPTSAAAGEPSRAHAHRRAPRAPAASKQPEPAPNVAPSDIRLER